MCFWWMAAGWRREARGGLRKTDKSSFITGQALMVDGGLTIQLQDPLAFHMEQTLRERGWQW